MDKEQRAEGEPAMGRREGLIFSPFSYKIRFIRLPVLLKSYPALSLSAPVPS